MDTKKIFLEFGFNEEDYIKIRNFYMNKNLCDTTFLIKVKECFITFSNYSFNNTEIVKIIRQLPTIILFSNERIEEKIKGRIELFGYSREEAITLLKKSTYFFNLSHDSLKEKMSGLISLGYTKEDISKIIKKLPVILSHSIDSFKQKIDDLISLGYTKEEVINMSKKTPSIYTVSTNTLKQKIDGMMSLGFTREDIIKMSKQVPAVLSYSIDSIKQKVEGLINIGYNKDTIIKIIKKSPSLLGISPESLKQRINDIMNLGYTKEEVISLSMMYPLIFILSLDNIKQKIVDLIDLGYTKEEVLKMTLKFPNIYDLTINNLKEKIEYYESINIKNITIINPKALMQSLSLTKARYSFYKENGTFIDMNNYKMIFIDNNKFENKYGLNNQELLERYSNKSVEKASSNFLIKTL